MFRTKNKNLTLFAVSLLLTGLFGLTACSKKATGIKAQIKDSTNLNPSVSSAADQQAAAQNANYTIKTVSVPNVTDSGVTVDVQLSDPAGNLLPVTTTHSLSNLDSQGTYSDAQRNLQVYVWARCSDAECFKYVLVVTVARGNQGLYQSLAISYANDCQFNLVSSTGSVGQFYLNLQSAMDSNYVKNTVPRGDLGSCSN